MSEQGPKVLVVDDDPAIRQFLCASLKANGYSVYEASTGEQALKAASVVRPELILLDLGLPDMDGKEIARSLRESTQTPIIILSVREAESEKRAALNAGADDYVTKPFRTGELLTRMRAVLRWSGGPQSSSGFSAGDLSVDPVRQVVRVGQDEVQLTPTEYDLLNIFILHAGKILSDTQLVRRLWAGMSYEDGARLLRIYIGNLRRKLEADPTRPRYILTEPGVGYRMQTED